MTPTLPTAGEVFVFFTKGERLSSNLICRVDDSPFSHVGIGFKLSDGSEIYYEALVGRGFRGPTPIDHLIGWQAEKPAARSALILYLPVLADVAEIKRLLTATYSETVTYSEWQLVAIFFAIKFGWKIPESLSGVVCSEIVARILVPQIDLRDAKHPIFDLVTPGTAWRNLNRLDQWTRAVHQARFFTVRYAAGALPHLPTFSHINLPPSPFRVPRLEVSHA